MNRVYVQFSIDQLKSDNRARYYLSYLKIRCVASKLNAGYFTFIDFCDAIDLKERSARKHLNALLKQGFIQDKGNGKYKIVRALDLFKSHRKNKALILTDSQLMAYSVKDISFFRSELIELANQKVKDAQKALVKGYTVYSQKDKCRIKVQDNTLREWDDLLSVSYTVKLTGLSESTIKRLRKKQTLVNYTSKTYCYPAYILQGDLSGKNLHQTRKGFWFPFNGQVFFTSTSKRILNTDTIIKRV